MKQLTLGEFIRRLEQVPADSSIKFDFVYFKPKGIHSYRGDYSQLALGYTNEGDPKVSEILELCRDAVGRKFYGYKGGEYYMDEETPMWVANSDEAGRTAIVNVRNHGWIVTIETESHEM